MKPFSEETKQRMSESAKKRCNAEWIAKQHARATPLDHEKVKSLYEQGMTQAEIAEMMKVSQKVIWRHMKNHNLKARIPIKRNQWRENNSSWRGGRSISEKGYILIKKPGHPRASICGDYVEEHILVMESYLGRYLVWKGPGHPDSEIIHHINGNKKDNRIENLSLTTYVEHINIHLKKESDA